MKDISGKKIKLFIGLSLILFGLIGLINVGFISQTIVIMFMFVFGQVAYWFFFPFAIINGILIIIFREKQFKIKNNVILIGLGLFTFALLILVTTIPHYSGSLDFGSFNRIFYESWLNSITPFKGNGYIRVSPLATNLGGGWIGYFFSTILNVLITPLGTIISVSVVFLIALILILYQPIKILINKRKGLQNISNPQEIETNNSIQEFNNTPQEYTKQTNPTNENAEFIENDDEFSSPNELSKANLYSNNDSPKFEEKKKDVLKENELKRASFMDEENSIIDEIPNINKDEKIKINKPYVLPPLSLLKEYKNEDILEKNEANCKNNEAIINATFSALRVGAKVIGHTIGPRVTRYDVQVDATASLQNIPKYVSDISQRLGGVNARFEPIVAGKVTSGLEVPNLESATIGFKEIVSVIPKGDKYILSIPFGKNITGEIKHSNLASFPHLLIGGATGSGKSVFVHSMIMTLIMRNTPNEVRLLLIDPKHVEFTHYKNSPFLLCPVVTDPKQAKVALEKLIDEMERRYSLFENNLTNNITSYNNKIKSSNGETLPYIVCIVDEFADLIQQNKKIDLDIARIAAKARAAGIHLIIATQRPSVDVITGTIKSNLPVRVALRVPDVESSKTILGGMGAEQLLGNGDMLVSCPPLQANGFIRAQGCYITEEEIDAVVKFINDQREPSYDPRFLNLEPSNNEEQKNEEPKISATEARALRDEDLYNYVKEQVSRREYTSISLIERENQIGFTRAGRLFKRLQDEGLISLDSVPGKGSKVYKEKFNLEKEKDNINSGE